MTTNINTSMGLREWGMLILLSLLWGGSFFFVGVAVDELPPLTIVWFRVALGALTLWIVVGFLRLPIPRNGKVWLSILLMGCLNNVIPFSLIVWGQTHIASGLASVFNGTTPLFTVLVAAVFLADERISGTKVVGVALGFIGVLVMMGPEVLSGLGANVLGQLAILGAAISYAFAAVFGRRFKGMDLNPIVLAAGQVTMSTLVLLPLMWFVDQPLTLSMPGMPVILSVLALAVFSTGLAYILFFRLLASAGATNLSLVTFLIPVSAILLGVFVLGEQLEFKHYLGMGFIALGLIAIDGRWKQWNGAQKA
ncbi:MAG: DMT family transporter [Thiolinea sp.]